MNDKLSSLGFIAAALASAIGIGNLWRFPYTALKYGSEFFLSYIIAVAFGILTIISEIKKPKGLERILFLFAITELTIIIYYAPLTASTLNYISDNVKVNLPIAAFIITLLSYIVVKKGLAKGIEPFSKFVIVLLFILLTYTAINHPLKLPSFREENLTNPILWIDSLAQALFSLSAGMGIFYLYSKHTTIKNPILYAIAIAIGDSIAAFMGYIIVSNYALEHSFYIGFEGLSLAMSSPIRELFFISLFLAAFSSLVSMLFVPFKVDKRLALIAVPLSFIVAYLSIEPIVDGIATKLLLPITASLISIISAQERVLGKLSPILYIFPILFFIATYFGSAG